MTSLVFQICSQRIYNHAHTNFFNSIHHQIIQVSLLFFLGICHILSESEKLYLTFFSFFMFLKKGKKHCTLTTKQCNLLRLLYILFKTSPLSYKACIPTVTVAYINKNTCDFRVSQYIQRCEY